MALSGGFGTLVGFVHDWANPENTFRSWDMVARYVVPEINGYLAGLRKSREFVATNREYFDRARDAVMAKITENDSAAEALKVTSRRCSRRRPAMCRISTNITANGKPTWSSLSPPGVTLHFGELDEGVRIIAGGREDTACLGRAHQRRACQCDPPTRCPRIFSPVRLGQPLRHRRGPLGSVTTLIGAPTKKARIWSKISPNCMSYSSTVT